MAIMNCIIIDTNVILVTSGQHQDISLECHKNCILQLQLIEKHGHVVIDDGYRILQEYSNKTTPNRPKNLGDAFVKWLQRNKGNASRCTQISITEHHERGFESFPDDPELHSFDPPDRKFVAVAAAHPEKPRILQAADCKWLDWESALNRHGINVEFICKDDVERFHKKKFGSNG
jgi:hypothetical protein